MKIKQKIEKIFSNQKSKLLFLKEKLQLKSPLFRSRIPSKKKVKKVSKEKISLIGPFILIKGKLSGYEDLSIYGTVEGKIVLKNHTLIIEPEGKVMGEIRGKRIINKGSVSGNVYATELVIINKTGSLKGDIFSPRITIADGAHFEGNAKIEGPSDLVLPFKEKREKKVEEKEKTEEGNKELHKGDEREEREILTKEG